MSHPSNDLDALMTDIRHLIATWAARQVQAAVTPAQGERRGEPRVTWHFWCADRPGRTACGNTGMVPVTISPAGVTCQGCLKTTVYKTALAGGDP